MEAWKDELYHYGVKGMKWRYHKYATLTPEQARNAEINYRRLNGMVENTMKGNYGNEAERQKRLGVNYNAVQSEVNRRILGRDATPGNYAKDDTKYSSEDWRRTLEAQRKARESSASNANKIKAINKKTTVQKPTRSKSRQRGYDFAKNVLSGRKKDKKK